MKDRIVELLGLIVLTFLLGGLCYFADAVYTDHYNRAHPTISAPLPKTTDELQTPPLMQAFQCDDGRKYSIIYAVSNPNPAWCHSVDVKG